MKFNEFINYVKNANGIDMDGYYGKQCMDLSNFYEVNVLGLEKGKTGASCAKELLNNAYLMSNVERINNYPAFVPKKGDIAVFTGGQYGHVAICLGEGDVNKFKTLDQNWKAQQLTEEWHNYATMGPIVFLRPKNQSNIENNKYEPGSYEVTAKEGLNVRAGAGTNYNKVTAIGCGSKQGVDRVQGNWGHLMNNVGWICLDYCKRI